MYNRIYLVDDMEVVNLMHQVLLRQLSLEEKVKSFTNPEEALDDLRFNSDTQGPILVLLDVCMPEMTGFEFLEFMTLESLPLNIDVVIVTSSVSEEYRVLAGQYQQYVCDILTKPIRIQDLRAITDRKHTLEY